MRDGSFAVALLLAGCAAPAAAAPPASSTAAPSSPAQEELARLDAEFRRGDQEVGDLLAENPPPACRSLDRVLGDLARISLRICELSTTRDERRSHPGVPCRYTRERLTALSLQAHKIGCKRTERYPDLRG